MTDISMKWLTRSWNDWQKHEMADKIMKWLTETWNGWQDHEITDRNMEWLTRSWNGWQKHEKAENVVSTNLVNFQDHFTITTIIVLKIKHTEESTIVLGVLGWHIDIWESLIRNVRERRSSKQLKSIVKPFTEFFRNAHVMPVLVILLFPVLRIQNINLFVDFVDTIHRPMCIVENRYEDL